MRPCSAPVPQKRCRSRGQSGAWPYENTVRAGKRSSFVSAKKVRNPADKGAVDHRTITIWAFRCLWWVVVVWGDAGGWVGGMDTSCLFTAALQLRGPWKVGSVDFRDAGDGGRGLHIMIGFEPGVRFHCPETGCRGRLSGA